MPTTYEPPNTLDAIKDRRQRKELTNLLRERAFLTVAMSLKSLLAAGLTPDQITQCVAAWDDKSEYKLKDDMNNRIAAILTDNGITSLREQDAFGNTKDYIWMEGGSAVLNSGKLRTELLARKIAPDVVAEIIESATTRSKYYTLQCRSVKEEATDDQTPAVAPPGPKGKRK